MMKTSHRLFALLLAALLLVQVPVTVFADGEEPEEVRIRWLSPGIQPVCDEDVITLFYAPGRMGTRIIVADPDTGLLGAVDTDGKLAVPCRYRAEEDQTEEGLAAGLILVRKYDDRGIPAGYGYADTDLNEVTPCVYQYIEGFEDGYAVVSVLQEDGASKEGVISLKGETVIPAVYHEIQRCRDGLVRAVRYEDSAYTYGLLDASSGAAVIPVSYEGIGDGFYDGLVWFGKQEGYEERYGYLDRENRVVIPAQYTRISAFSEGLAAVAVRGEGGQVYGYIDTEGEVQIPFQYSHAESFRDGMAVVTVAGDGGEERYGVIDRKGHWVLEPSFYRITREEDYYELIEKRYDPDLDGYIFVKGAAATDGRILIPCGYQYIVWNGQHFILELRVYNEERDRYSYRYGVAAADGRILIPCIYDRIAYSDYRELFRDGPVAIGMATGQLYPFSYVYGFADASGELLTPLQYYGLTDQMFRDGRCLVGVPDPGREGELLYGYIDASGKEVIPCRYSDADSFYGGRAWVRWYDEETGEECDGYIDTEGKAVAPAGNDRAFLDPYDDYIDLADGITVVTAENPETGLGYGIVDSKTGREILPAEYMIGNAESFMDLHYYLERRKESGGFSRENAAEYYRLLAGALVLGKEDGHGNLQYGLFAKDGTQLVPCEYAEMALVRDGQYGYVKKGISYGLFENPVFEARPEEDPEPVTEP
ncbi:MAG: WG repeat-containing protein, partial [Lachnospiraceae bacterium]|nr:WG repeat-containing protein [Lachnospiraceae bacterium]